MCCLPPKLPPPPLFRGTLRAVLVGSEPPEDVLPIESISCVCREGRAASLPSCGRIKDQGKRTQQNGPCASVRSRGHSGRYGTA